MKTDCDVLVIGAGITGLTTAFRLHQRALRVELIEAAPRVGGVIGTERVQGMLYEHGPNSILDTTPLIDALLHDVGMSGERIEMNPACSRRYVVRNGSIHALPASPAAFVATPLFSVAAKLRLLREPFIERAQPGVDESVAEFVTRRLGTEFLDYAVEPFVAGVYAGVPEELSLGSAFPRLHALEQRYGSLLKGQFLGARERSRQDERSRHTAKTFSFKSGLQTLTNALARAGPRARVVTRATAIRPQTNGVIQADLAGGDGPARVSAHAIVLAVPAYVAATLVRPVCPDATAALDAIPYAPVASVASAYARRDIAHPLDGFGFLAPRVERRRILGSLFSSSMFEGRAPADTVLLTTFLGGRRHPALAVQSEDDIARVVHHELTSLLGAHGAPALTAITRRERAIPQYTLGHQDRIRRAEQAQDALPGLFLSGSYRGGVSVGDCIKSAHEMADAVAQHVLAARR
ncbi:MAG: protoporphyrinogen oxidase [Burkholderiales bacterium]